MIALFMEVDRRWRAMDVLIIGVLLLFLASPWFIGAWTIGQWVVGAVRKVGG